MCFPGILTHPLILFLLLCKDQSVILINPGLVDKVIVSNTDNMLRSFEKTEESTSGKKVPVEWLRYDGKEYDEGFRLKLSHSKMVSQVTWHGKGDYFASVMPKGESMANPFSKSKGLVQCVLFHPVRPFLFVAVNA
ncbi:hypothetical protein KUTeg_019448 [Tegillarca granosa]|uniref:Uncharacterized protein n=1 Tax=Tegillarca granosa TaxID=220873 RepID=A0ABQ9ECL8_TEGGR|nr:hypothetical protein KUTeg_019448 [Tegillarca granosa]